MTADDSVSLSRLFSDVLHALPYYNNRAKAAELAKYSPESLCAAVSNDVGSVLVAKVGQRLAGFCFSREDDGLIWLSWFGVHQDHRREGIAFSLLNALDVRARRAGAHKIWCDCRTENDSSKQTLETFGYRPICTMPNHWYGQDYILWERLVG